MSIARSPCDVFSITIGTKFMFICPLSDSVTKYIIARRDLMRKSGIYQIILKEDQRSYIGSAFDIEKRWSNHISASKRNGAKQVIANALAKYGVENFEWIILEECSQSELLLREQYWLDLLRPFADEGRGFNIRKEAKNNSGIVRSAESKKKQSETMKGKPKSEEHKRNMSKNWREKRGAEYFDNLRKRVSGENNPSKRPEVAEKISKSMTGKTWKHDADRVAKHIAHRKNKKASEELRAKLRAVQQKNKTRSQEAKHKFYLAQRKLYLIVDHEKQETFNIYSRELKIFCSEHNLTYENLIGTAKTGKLYKKRWQANRIEE